MWGGHVWLSIAKHVGLALANVFGETVCSAASERKHGPHIIVKLLLGKRD